MDLQSGTNISILQIRAPDSGSILCMTTSLPNDSFSDRKRATTQMARCKICRGQLDPSSGDGVAEPLAESCESCAPKRRNKLHLALNGSTVNSTVKSRIRAYEQQLRRDQAEAKKKCLGLEETEAEWAAEMKEPDETGKVGTHNGDTEAPKLEHRLEHLDEERTFAASMKFWDDVRAQLRTDSDEDELDCEQGKWNC